MKIIDIQLRQDLFSLASDSPYSHDSGVYVLTTFFRETNIF